MELNEIKYDEQEEFNEFIDDEYSKVEINGEIFLPSEILFNLKKEAYRIALTDFKNQKIEDFKQSVYDSYPTPIAYYFRQTYYGYHDNNNRLHLLRSTWEAIIFVLYAIVVGEARKKNFPLRVSGIRESDLYYFSLDKKLGIIEKILTYNNNNAFGLKCGNCFAVADIIKLKELNYKRNGFQHLAVLSEVQAATLFAELEPEVIDALKSIANIQNIELLQFSHTDGSPLALRCETFIGESPNRTYKTYHVTAAQIAFVGTELNTHTVMAKIDDEIFAITPFIHFKLVDEGHVTKLCYLHQLNPVDVTEFKFEISTRAVYTMMPVTDFADRMNELAVLTT